MATAEVINISQPVVSAPPDSAIIYTQDLWKTYDMGSEQQVHALRGVNLQIRRNEYAAIMGPSGSGKSTLMNLIGCLDSPSRGQYWLNGQQVSELAAAIDPTGRYLLAANQGSNNIVVFRIHPSSGRLTPTGQVLDVPSPVCIKFVALD